MQANLGNPNYVKQTYFRCGKPWGRYFNESPYPQPVLDWAQTSKKNGLVISDLRQQVKNQLQQAQGEEYKKALAAKETVDKDWKHNS